MEKGFYVLWSPKKGMFFKAGAAGHTDVKGEAGVFSKKDAEALAARCGCTILPAKAILPTNQNTQIVIADIAAERRRQIEAEGWSPEHDDTHNRGELAVAAGCYAMVGCFSEAERRNSKPVVPYFWPWGGEFWKPTTPRRDLIKAAALIVAEIERLDRAAGKEGLK